MRNSPMARTAANPRHVLVVDDDDDLVATLGLYIAASGVGTCMTAHSLEEVRDQDEATECDVAILDVNLGADRPSGVDVANWLRAHDFRGKIVFLTGHARSSPLVARAASEPGTLVLSKPIPGEELIRIIRDARSSVCW
jgi:DNA-binding response OmpR family regulator